MKHFFKFIGTTGVFAVFLFGCHSSQKSPSLSLYVAASLTDVLTEVGELYQKTTGIDVDYNFAGSGALAQQLIASPQADLFFSANDEWVNELERKKMVVTRRTFLSNQLVVVANVNSVIEFDQPESFAFIPFEYLCMGDPRYVPAGRYAMDWLESIESTTGESVWARVKDKVSPVPDVRSVSMQVEGSIDVVGIVYGTDYAHRSESLKLLYEVPVEDGPKIKYTVAMLKVKKQKEATEEFLYFLAKPEVLAIFKRHGFIPVNE